MAALAEAALLAFTTLQSGDGAVATHPMGLAKVPVAAKAI
ncbi:hypothetical protein OAN307_c33760 [Octadecabacter antarcticus 307]|uniref:Uncharacterized protein n=1 Tax=Octadecabacter antarcticus 307 TaxID=391626 RepID=M9RGE5_9RHOB|nr:hypothetical protein OAN307_c33760 [Octadecabacter antarcticus 307]